MSLTQRLCQWVVAVSALTGSTAIACSCAVPIDPDYFVDRSKSIIVAIPDRAELAETPDPGQSRILASVTLLDVLKGPRPKTLPVMISWVYSRGAINSCARSMEFGKAYVLFLEKVDQPNTYIDACAPHKPFEDLRYRYEELCKTTGPGSKRCSRKLLKMLRNATVANEGYSFQ